MSAEKQYTLPNKNLYTYFSVFQIKFKQFFNISDVNFLNIGNGTIHPCSLWNANNYSVNLLVNS